MNTRNIATALKVSLVSALLAALAGCATAYQSEGLTGGFVSKQLANNKYLVTFSGNGFTTAERASDFAMMRGAQLALMHGYKYFVVFNSNTAMNEDDIYTGYTVSASFKPTSKYLILATRTPPKQYSTYFNARNYFAETAKKYGLHVNPGSGPFVPDPSVVKFDFPSNAAALPAVKPGAVRVYTDTRWMFDRTWNLVGTYTYYEQPLTTMQDFLKIAEARAAAHGANGLMVINNPAKVQDKDADYGFQVPKSAGFIAEAVYFPPASLGVDWEPGAMKIGEYVVREFRETGAQQKNGLLLGDKVLKIQGVDVLDHAAIAKLHEDWKVGETIKLTIVRDGHERVITQHLVSNG